jgi:hypothetical protein
MRCSRTETKSVIDQQAQKPDGKYRKIKVAVSADIERRLGKLVIMTRRGYYAQ